MIQTGTAEHGRRRRRFLRLDNGFEYFKGEWLEAPAGSDPAPTAFLIEQAPGSTLPTHFHEQNEFQVVVAGDGLFGRHAVHAVSVHYAGAYTGYGPIVAGASGLSYFTIRSVLESGAHFLPEARDRLKRGPKVQRFGEPIDPLQPEQLRSIDAISVEDNIACEDGMFARVMRLPPGATLPIRHEGPSSGQYQMVLAGALCAEVSRLERFEMVFVTPDDADARLVAGPDGAQVLVLQLPQRALDYQV
jgi:quercetin dioxygenase-like cupin family protein